jgi:predicted MFS family arabinose efflux permease
MGFIEAPIHALLLYGVVFAIGSAAISITPIGVILTKWYPSRVGMANSIAISGMGVGQLLIISVLTSQLVSMGWRGSFIILGAATVLLVLPIVLVAGRSQPPDELNDRDESSRHSNAPGNKGSYSSLPQALRSTKLWILLLVYAICGFQDFLVATHVVAFALDEGISALIAGNMLAFMGLAGLAGVLITGLLNDRYGPVLPTALCFLIRIAIFSAILFSQTPAIIVGAALLYGTTFWITAPLTVVFAQGLCNFALLGTLSGLITMVHHFAGGLGAFSGGWIFETSGTYEPAFQALLVMSVVALLLTWPLRKQHPA